MASCSRMLPTNFWLQHFRLLAVFLSLKTKTSQASAFYKVQHHPSTPTSMNSRKWGQIASNLKWNIEWVMVLVWSKRGAWFEHIKHFARRAWSG
jgi:hypothetical protein